jgi:RNA ligase (TIGR02306 family)
MENPNSVCYVGAIGEIVPIIGADNLELALVGGWQAIVKKDEYKVGNLVVIATTDAVIPQDLSDEIGVTNYLRKGGRVRTVKLRGVYSECLIMSKNTIPALRKHPTIAEGEDLMELLGIFKYEPPAVQVQLSSGRKIKYHQNPNFGVYYKFPNLKNVAGLFTEHDGVQITRKLHGTNARYGIVKKSRLSFWDKVRKFFGNEWIDYEYVYGSHNVEKGSDSQGFYDTDVWRTVAENYKIKEKLWAYVKAQTDGIGSGIILYGEIYGAGIQKNYDYGLKDIQFAGFDFVEDGVYQSTFFAQHVIENLLGLLHVPILYHGLWSQEIQDKFVFNNFIEGTKIPHEGIVIKHVTGERKKVAKVINPDYLIYGEKHNVGDSH